MLHVQYPGSMYYIDTDGSLCGEYVYHTFVLSRCDVTATITYLWYFAQCYDSKTRPISYLPHSYSIHLYLFNHFPSTLPALATAPAPAPAH